MCALSRWYDQPGSYAVGDVVLVARDPGLEPAEAEIVADSQQRPHVVKVIYRRSRNGAWIARTRIVGLARGRPSTQRAP